MISTYSKLFERKKHSPNLPDFKINKNKNYQISATHSNR
jgi:hypothetical protein